MIVVFEQLWAPALFERLDVMFWMTEGVPEVGLGFVNVTAVPPQC